MAVPSDRLCVCLGYQQSRGSENLGGNVMMHIKVNQNIRSLLVYNSIKIKIFIFSNGNSKRKYSILLSFFNSCTDRALSIT